ncbi:MAG TPA: hypothetical protein VJT72_16720 [Pseudonocardiaceae bacterium]|nr:hypothetical protein [Pseudonocardiaceae bacterium]
MTLEDPAPDDAEPENRALDSEDWAADEMLGNGQLILPLPTGPTRKKNGSGGQISKPRLERDPPSRSTSM